MMHDHSDNYHEDISNEDSNDHRSVLSLCSISTINNGDLNKDSFNLKEFSIIDSTTGKSRAPRQNEFLYLILENPSYSSYVSWLNRNEGLFKIDQPERVAKLWGKVKNRQTSGVMRYDIFARGLRYYYKSGSMIKTNKKHTFRFKLPLS